MLREGVRVVSRHVAGYLVQVGAPTLTRWHQVKTLPVRKGAGNYRGAFLAAEGFFFAADLGCIGSEMVM